MQKPTAAAALIQHPQAQTEQVIKNTGITMKRSKIPRKKTITIGIIMRRSRVKKHRARNSWILKTLLPTLRAQRVPWKNPERSAMMQFPAM